MTEVIIYRVPRVRGHHEGARYRPVGVGYIERAHEKRVEIDVVYFFVEAFNICIIGRHATTNEILVQGVVVFLGKTSIGTNYIRYKHVG